MPMTPRLCLCLSLLLPLSLSVACDKDEGNDETACQRVHRNADWPGGFPDGSSGDWPDTGDDWATGGDWPDTGDEPDTGDTAEPGDDSAGEPMMMGENCPIDETGDDSAGNESAGDTQDTTAGDTQDTTAGDSAGDTAGDSAGQTTGADSGDDSGGQGQLGENCMSADDCAEGKCILTSEDLGFCTRQCVKAEDCPEEGWVCNLAPYTACVPDV